MKMQLRDHISLFMFVPGHIISARLLILPYRDILVSGLCTELNTIISHSEYLANS